MKIDPTPGRVVWYRPGDEDTVGAAGEILAALVAKVLPEGRVNLLVVDEVGRSHSRQNVILRQEEDEPPKDNKSYCEWMPYQISQAKKHAEPEPRTPETEFVPEVGEQAVPDDVPVTESLGEQRPFRKKK